MKNWAKDRPKDGPISDIFISRGLAISADVRCTKDPVLD